MGFLKPPSFSKPDTSLPYNLHDILIALILPYKLNELLIILIPPYKLNGLLIILILPYKLNELLIILIPLFKHYNPYNPIAAWWGICTYNPILYL